MGKGKGTGSGRPKKETPKRISGTGYTYAESRQLKHVKQSDNGSYEIDIDKIRDTIQEYIITHADKAMSRPGLRAALGIYNQETYNLWAEGYVNRDHRDNEGYIANIELSDAVRAGDTAIARYLCEDEDSKKSSLTIRMLETMGELAPAQTKTTHDVNIAMGKWGKYSR